MKENLFAGIRYTWKGWDVDKSGAERILDEIQGMYQSDLFRRPDLNSTKAIQFYNATMNVSLYREAIDYILSLPDATIQQIFADYSKPNLQHIENQDVSQMVPNNPWANSVISDRNSIQKNWKKNPAKASEDLADLLYVAESQLTFNGFKKMAGGIQNIFIRGNFDGFRVGDQAGQHSLTSQSLGKIGSEEPQGPLATVQGVTSASSGELFISWLLSNL